MQQQIPTGFEKYGKTTRRAQFLAGMERVVPWADPSEEPYLALSTRHTVDGRKLRSSLRWFRRHPLRCRSTQWHEKGD
jgi:hypothetical protein